MPSKKKKTYITWGLDWDLKTKKKDPNIYIYIYIYIYISGEKN